MISIEDAEVLIKLARESIKCVFENCRIEVTEDIRQKFSEKAGVFVTIKTFPEKQLRGCIGFPYPIYPLWFGIIKAAIAAAFEDPRFPPLSKEELDNVVLEISILTTPEEIEYSSLEDLKSKITIGKHGLIAQRGFLSGLLLPQVPVEEKWDVETFIKYTCLKAGLEPECWRNKNTKFYRFSADVFEEETPRGKVIKKEL